MRTRLLILSGIVLLAVGFAPAPLPRSERGRRVDQTDVGGTWQIVLWEYDRRRHVEYEKRYGAELTRERFVLTNGGGTYELRLDATTSPPSFTWAMGGRGTHVGSYRLNGGEMTMVFVSDHQAAQRPTDFSQCPPNGWRFIMRRLKRD